MESVLALQNSLVRISQALIDVMSRSSRLDDIFQKMTTSLRTSISIISKVVSDEKEQLRILNENQQVLPQKKSFWKKLTGGDMLNAHDILENVEGTSGIKQSLEEVEVVLPYISSNITLLKKSCKEAQEIAENAKKINVKLAPIVQRSASLLDEEGVPQLDTSGKVLLTAFNSTMARLHANVRIVTDIAKDLMLDMGNAMEIFQQLHLYSAKAQSRGLKPSVESSINLVLSDGAALAVLIQEINQILIKDAAHSKLIASSVYGYVEGTKNENPIDKLRKKL
jgi:hypothetical protein